MHPKNCKCQQCCGGMRTITPVHGGTVQSISPASASIPGPPGPRGPQGPVGSQGLIGPEGPAGVDGADGADGAPGAPGQIQSINALVDPDQFLVTGTGGTDFNISSVGDTHTFNIPNAGALNRGLLGPIAGLTAQDLLVASSSSAFGRLAVGGNGQVLTIVAGVVTWAAAAATGITSINSLTAAAQTLTSASTGNDFSITSVLDTHTFSIPSASATARGLVTTGAQTLAGQKTFSSAPLLSSLTASLPLKLDGAKVIVSAAINLSGAEVTGNLPVGSIAPGSNGEIITTVAGVAAWAAASATGITTLNTLTGAVQTFSTQAGGTDFTITSSGTDHKFEIPDAGATARGLVTVNAQIFAGKKNFTTAPLFSSLTASLPLKLDASKNVFSAAIDLSTAEVTGLLPETSINPGANGDSLQTIAGVVTWAPASGGTGITTLNTLNAAVQTFATGTAGTDFNISSVTSTHTFNIPDASALNRGLINNGIQTIGGPKTFDGVMSLSYVIPPATSIPIIINSLGQLDGGAIDLSVSAAMVSGVLEVINGGTGNVMATMVTGSLIIGANTTVMKNFNPGANGTILVADSGASDKLKYKSLISSDSSITITVNSGNIDFVINGAAMINRVSTATETRPNSTTTSSVIMAANTGVRKGGYIKNLGDNTVAISFSGTAVFASAQPLEPGATLTVNVGNDIIYDGDVSTINPTGNTPLLVVEF